MKNVTLFLVSLFAFAGVSAQVFESDFTDWTDGLPDGWNGSRTNIDLTAVTQADNDMGMGDYALQLVNADTQHKRFSTQPLTTQNATSYEVTYMVRGTGDIRVGLYDNRPEDFGYTYADYASINSADWVEVTQSVVCANDNNASEFILSVRSTSGDIGVQVDYVVVTTADIPTVSINAIQNAMGASPLEGSTVLTGGIVSAVIPAGGNNGFFIQDNEGAYNGVFVFTDAAVTVGDSVTFIGNVVEFFNMTQLSGIAGLTIVSSGNSLYAPAEITTAEVNTEAYEGVLVRVSNATCTDANSGFGQWIVNDGSGSALINPAIYEATRTQGTAYNVTGPVFYSFDEFKILPRNGNDVEAVVGVSETAVSSAITAWPNPANEVLNLRFADGRQVNGFVRIFDAQGREVAQHATGATTAAISVEALAPGYYTAVVETTEGTSSIRFVKQ